MEAKVPELNRRTLSEKVKTLIERLGVTISDMPADWLPSIIALRNKIVHTGITDQFGDNERDTLDHTVIVREIVTRVILQRIGFVGAYRSWLHHETQLHFPECVTMDRWVDG